MRRVTLVLVLMAAALACVPAVAPSAAPPTSPADRSLRWVRIPHNTRADRDGGICGLRFSPDGSLLAVSCRDRQIRLLTTRNWTVIRSIGSPTIAGSLAFSPDGRLLASEDSNGHVNLIRLWDVQTGKAVRVLKGHTSLIYSFTFTPDGLSLLSCGSEAQVLRWTLATGKYEVVRAAPGRAEPVAAILSGPGRVTVLDRDGVIETFATGNSKRPVERRWLRWASVDDGMPSQGSFKMGQFTPGGRGAVVQFFDVVALGYPAGVDDEPAWLALREYKGKVVLETVDRIGLSSTGRLTYFSTDRGNLHLVETATGQHLAKVKVIIDKSFWALASSPCGRYAAVGEEGSEVVIWDTEVAFGPLPVVDASKQRDLRWAELTSDDALLAYRALAALSHAPEADALALNRLRPSDANAARVAGLLRDLDSDTYTTREAARRSLEVLGQAAGPFLRKALAAKPSVEVKARLTELVRRLDGPKAWGRDGRALDLLERRGTKEACRVLEAIAKDDPGGWFAVEAREALGRLTGRGLYKPKKD